MSLPFWLPGSLRSCRDEGSPCLRVIMRNARFWVTKSDGSALSDAERKRVNETLKSAGEPATE
jgi:hypothetical protein